MLDENRDREADAHGELAMVATLGVAIGLMSVDQGSPSYLMPFVKPALQLDNAQIGASVSAYWVMFAIGSALAGAASEKLGRKRLLVLLLASFALCSVLPSLARNFTQFAATRGVMGLQAGAMFALCQSILAQGSSPTTMGRNMGLVTGFAGNIFGMLIAPVVLVQVAVALGWRAGFLTVIAPMVVCALFAWVALREPEPLLARGTSASASSFKEIAGIKNVWLCGLLCSLFVAYVALGLAFLPLYLMEARHLTSAQMSLLISLLGLSAIVYSVALPFKLRIASAGNPPWSWRACSAWARRSPPCISNRPCPCWACCCSSAGASPARAAFGQERFLRNPCRRAWLRRRWA